MAQCMRVEFFAAGKPEPQGSTRAFMVGDKPVITSTNKALRPWREVIGWEARRVHTGPPLDDAVCIMATFILPRPKSVKRKQPTVKPDLDKLIRGLLDALSGVLYADDAIVVSVAAAKVYEDPSNERLSRIGVRVIVVTA